MPDQKLVIFQQLKTKTKLAYSPYSHIKVACLLEDGQGRRAWGVNVENLSYGITVCAEQTALGNFITQWGVATIVKVYLFSPQTDFILPCGRCRQALVEHQNHHLPTTVITFEQNGNNKQYLLSELIPHSFTIN